MSALTDRLRGRRRAARRRRAAPSATPPRPTPSCAPAATRSPSEVAELTWDLGGLTYEMAIRDHFRLDVLVRRAAALQERDAELGEVERLLAAAEEGVGGDCRSCGAAPQPRRRLLLEVRPAAHAPGGERGADRADRQRRGALGLRHAPATNERRFLPVWRAVLVVRW